MALVLEKDEHLDRGGDGGFAGFIVGTVVVLVLVVGIDIDINIDSNGVVDFKNKL